MASNEWLVRKLHEQDKKIEALSRGGTGVGHTSIAPGENLTVISDNGEVVLGAGGVEHVDGPTPATPSAPTLKLGFGTIETTWDGTFAEGEDEDGVPLTAPIDFDVVEVHCSTDPEEEEWGDDTRRGQIKTREGGTITVGGFDVDDEVFVCLIALAKTGKRSAPSATTSLVIEGLDFSQLFNELDAANATIKNAGEILVTEQGTLGEKLAESDAALDTLEVSLGELDETTLPALRNDLDAAEGRLTSAEGQITDAFGEIASVRTSVDGKNKTTQSTSTPPAQYAGVVGDTWEVMSSMGSGGRTVSRWRWNGTVWVSTLIGSESLSSVDGSKLTGEVNGELVKPGSIYADRIVSGLSQNMVPDPGFINADITADRLGRANSYGATMTVENGVLVVDAPQGVTRGPDFSLAANSDLYAWAAYPSMPVVAKAQARVVGEGAYAEFRYSIRIIKRDGTRQFVSMNPSSYTKLTSEWTEIVGKYALPQDASGFSIVLQLRDNLQGRAEIRSPFVASTVGGTVIEDGAVDPSKLATEVKDSITSAASKADAAMTAANGLSKILHGTDEPGGDAPDGTIWWQHLGTLSGPVIGQWNRVSGSWVSTPISSEAIANLDTGKLTAGTAAIAEAVVAKIAAQTASIQQADIRNLFVTGTSKLNDVVAEQIAADTAQFIELEVGNLVAGTGTMDEATIQKLFSDVVVASMAQAQEFIGENAILTGAVTAPKITASEELWAKIGEFVKIRAEHMQADAIDGMVITGATYRTSGGNGSWSDAGLFIAQPDGTSMVRFPTDGSPLSLTASDTQIERASITALDLSDGAVRSGGELTLASGVTPPASPPELTTGWQKVCTLPAPEERHDIGGFGYWGEGAGHWVRAVNVLGTGEGDRVELYDAATGEFERYISIDCDPRNGLTVMGDIVYVFGGDHVAGNAPVIDGYNLVTGVRVSRHSYTRAIQAKNALGNDGTNLIVASVYNRELWVHKRNPTSGVQVGSDMRSGSNSWPGADASNLHGVSINAAGTEITVIPGVAARVYTISGGTLTHKADAANANGLAGWDNPAGPAGYVVRGGVPYLVDGVGDVYKGSTFVSDATVQMCFTWTDGTRETTPSPLVTFQAGAREVFTVSLPQRTGLAKRLYYRSTSGSWVMKGVAEGTTVYVVSDVQGFAAPLPTVNTFPNADPATLKSTNNKFVVHGDGSGTWGPLTFNTDGSMTGIPRTAAGRDVEMIAPSGGGIVDKTITFPPGRFTQPPAVTIGSHSTASTLYNIGVSGVTKDGFILSVNRANNTPTFVDWIATEVI